MLEGELGLYAGAVALGAVHGIEPGHGWPVAASYALDRSNEWLYGLAAGGIIGVGHLVSSLAMVGAFFYAKSLLDLAQVNEPIALTPGIEIGGPVSLVAGALLIGLGVREYVGGHGHDESGGRDHGHDDADHAHDGHSHDHDGHSHDHDHHDDRGHSHGGGIVGRLLPGDGAPSPDEAEERGLVGIAWFAFLLGFAHEEEFEIIAICAGSNRCLELMTAYALTVIAGIVGLTLLLVAGYRSYEERVERFTPYLPAFSAAVLIVMGLGFVFGLF